MVVGQACRSSFSFFPHDANEHNENQNDCDSRQYFPNQHVTNIRVSNRDLGHEIWARPVEHTKS